MSTIECCKTCVAPKRYPGCHGVCQEYLKEKEAYENRKAEYFKEERLTGNIVGDRGRKVRNALKGYRGNKYREK